MSARKLSPAFPPSSGTRGSHLAFALYCLPAGRRKDALIFYHFCRAVDDIADEPGRPPEEKRRLLAEWLAAVDLDLPPEIEGVVQRHNIDRSLLTEIIRGCETDVLPARFPTIADLNQYCWRVACAVGLVSIRIFGCSDPRCRDYAENLGHALQLTNILRDVAEDAAMGRIYLPLEDLERFGVSESALLAGRPGAGFLPLMRFEAARARTRFAAAVPPPGSARTLFPAEVMRALYLKILRRMEVRGFPVFQERIRLGGLEKVTTAILTWLRGDRT